MIRAVVFDFDGLVIDSETPILRSAEEIFEEHGQSFPAGRLVSVVGSADHFDPMAHLAELLGPGAGFDVDAAQERMRRRYLELVEAQPILPGVLDRIREADELGWPRAVASSSRRQWVVGHLERLGLGNGWSAVRCRGEAPRAKPHPDLYEAAVADMGVSPAEAVALEDSPNGVRAAKAAGLWCVAVPGGLTAGAEVGEADLVAGSLAEITLREVAGRLDLAC